MLSEEEKLKTDILFQIDMQLYDEFNDKLCEINEHLGDIYTYKDLQDIENAEKEKERILLRKAVKELQKELEELKSIASEFTNRNIEQFSIGEFNFKVKHFKDNYIHKDRIREAIRDRELEIYADNEEICNADGFYNIAFLYDKTIDVLKELLEEG